MLLSLFQVELDSLAAGVTHVEETLQRLSDEQLSGQLAVVKVGHQRWMLYLSCYSGIFSVCFGHTGRTGERGSNCRGQAGPGDRGWCSGRQTDNGCKPHVLPDAYRHAEHSSFGIKGSSGRIHGRAKEEGPWDQALPSAPCWSWGLAGWSSVHHQLRDQTYIGKGCTWPDQGKSGEDATWLF